MPASSPATQATGRMVAAGHDRFDTPFVFLDADFNVVLSGRDTQGAACAVETMRRSLGGPPLHVHPDQDEWFFVREGRFDMVIGGNAFTLGPGDSLLAPRGVPHAFASRTPTARMLVTFFPAGDMEAFFHAAATLREPTPPEMAAVFAAHGMRVVGPPMPAA